MTTVLNASVSASALRKPLLTQARVPLTRAVEVRNELGEISQSQIPAERALIIYLDKKELVTLMTLGAAPEWLVLGFLRNQRLIDSVEQIESITVDWSIGEGEVGEPGVAAVKSRPDAQVKVQRSADRVVTTGCGQGSVFGDLMAHLDDIELPKAQVTQAEIYGVVNAIRLQETTYKSSGSVHGCALFQGDQMCLFVEDVGRHNAVDTIAGWMWMNDISGHDKVF
ncbi:MAG: Protein FdhD [Pseudomonadota bacterium]